MAAMKHSYQSRNDKIFGSFGCHEAFRVAADWFPPRYPAIDQGGHSFDDGKLLQRTVVAIVYELCGSACRPS